MGRWRPVEDLVTSLDSSDNNYPGTGSPSNHPPFDWSAHRVFVTGATGLLGSWVVTELQARGAQVVALVRDSVPHSHLWSAAELDHLMVVHGALEDFATVSRAINEYEVDTVFHLGAQTIVPIANRNPLSTFESNIRGSYNVLEACRLNPGVRAVVVASSDKAYGEHKVLPYTEDAPLLARHPYDASKACTDILSLSHAATFGLPVCVTRCGNLYGPGDLNWNRLIPGTIRSVLRGESPVVRSDGSLIRDYFFVRDGALAYIHLAQRMFEQGITGEAFNFSSEIQLTVLELVSRIVKVMGSNLEPVVLGEGAGEIRHQYLSAEKARTILGWMPEHTLEEGLATTIDWYRKQLAMSQDNSAMPSSS